VRTRRAGASRGLDALPCPLEPSSRFFPAQTYFQLCSEDYNWWWRSFLTSGSSALYLFIYSAVYFHTKLEITQVASAVLFFGYMAMISWCFFLMTGAVGFVSSLTFANKIYAAIKVD